MLTRQNKFSCHGLNAKTFMFTLRGHIPVNTRFLRNFRQFSIKGVIFYGYLLEQIATTMILWKKITTFYRFNTNPRFSPFLLQSNLS